MCNRNLLIIALLLNCTSSLAMKRDQSRFVYGDCGSYVGVDPEQVEGTYKFVPTHQGKTLQDKYEFVKEWIQERYVEIPPLISENGNDQYSIADKAKFIANKINLEPHRVIVFFHHGEKAEGAAYDILSLRRLIKEGKKLFPGSEIAFTKEDRGLIKLYREAWDCTENMTADQIEKETMRCLDKVCIPISNPNREDLTQEEDLIFRRFLRLHHLIKLSPVNKDNEDEKFNDYPTGSFYFRKSGTKTNHPKVFLFWGVIGYKNNKENKWIRHRVCYQSGRGFLVNSSIDQQYAYTDLYALITRKLGLNFSNFLKKDSPRE